MWTATESRTLVAVSFISTVAIFVVVRHARQKARQFLYKHSIPVVGCNTFSKSLFSAFHFVFSARALLYEAYVTGSGIAKIPAFGRWLVVLSTPKFVEELSKIPDNVVSLSESLSELLSAEHSLCPDYPPAVISAFIVKVARGPLTKHIGTVFGDIVDEMSLAVDEKLHKVTNDEWVAIPTSDLVTNVMTRIITRVMIGPAVSRDEEFMRMSTRLTVDNMITANVIGIVPKSMRRPVSSFIRYLQGTRRRIDQLLRPHIENRLKALLAPDIHAPITELPSDLTAWALEQADGENITVDFLIQVLLMLNSAAGHFTSGSFNQAVLHLAAHQDHIGPLREEVKRVVNIHGWTKRALNDMVKVDSFLKEVQRFYGVNMIAPLRKALQDFTLSDGTFVPAGTFVIGNAIHIHKDEQLYEHANSFNPLRFVDQQGSGLVNTSAIYLAFGHGRQACPGRFFASAVLKITLAYFLLNYDFKVDGFESNPKVLTFDFTFAISSNPRVRVLFKKRS